MPSLDVLTYNSVPLLIGKTLYLKQRAVMDDTGVRYLYTHFQIAVRFICNIRATQPVAAPGVVPPMSVGAAWPEIRRQLMQPRKQLTMRVGTATILESPQRVIGIGFAPTDANQGPHPIDCYVEAIIGQSTIVGVFVLETWLVECKDAPPSIISHQWECSEEIDHECLSTRTISGRVVFRPELLALRLVPGRPDGLRPDDFRGRFFHVTPPGYIRQSTYVTATADGTSCTYRIVDRERPWGTRGWVRRLTQHMTQGYDWLSQVNASFFRVWTVTIHAYPRIKSHTLIGILSQVFATATTFSGDTVTDGMAAIGVLGPGDPFAGDIRTRRRPFFAISVDLDLDTDGGPIASFTVRQTMGKTPLGLVDVFFVAPPLGAETLWPENAGVVAGPVNLGAPPGPMRFTDNPKPYAHGTRGSWLISLVAQKLSGRCDIPVAPADPGSALKNPDGSSFGGP